MTTGHHQPWSCQWARRDLLSSTSCSPPQGHHDGHVKAEAGGQYRAAREEQHEPREARAPPG